MAEIKRLHDIDDDDVPSVPNGVDLLAWLRERYELAYPDGPTWNSNPQVLINDGRIAVYLDEAEKLND